MNRFFFLAMSNKWWSEGGAGWGGEGVKRLVFKSIINFCINNILNESTTIDETLINNIFVLN
jgi:hypothetical protein